MTTFDTARIREAFPITQVLRARGIELRGGGAKGWRCACPIHGGDNREAFSIAANDAGWHCFTGDCGGGDVIKLVMLLDGVGFQEACARLGGETAKTTSTTPSTPRPAPRPKPAPEPLPALDRDKRVEMEEMADRLSGDRALIESLAASRGWEPATISALASTGALGWLDGASQGKGQLAFIYPTSIKVRSLWREGDGWRWSRPDGARHIRWHWSAWPWNKLELWRENMLRRPMRGRAIVVEGETDAITLIDRGANDYETDVAALPDAGIPERLKTRLPELFAGLDVVMAPDSDAPGQRAESDFTAAVKPFARTFQIIKS